MCVDFRETRSTKKCLNSDGNDGSMDLIPRCYRSHHGAVTEQTIFYLLVIIK